MIIGLSGYAGTGKDTVAKIIQYINCKNTGTITLEEAITDPSHTWWLEERSGWEIKKFAGKLKEVASILTGIPAERFEDQEFKKSFLGDEWNEWFINTPNQSRMPVRDFLQRLGTEAIRNNLHQNAWVNALMAEYKPLPRPIFIEGSYFGRCFICHDRFSGDKFQTICKRCVEEQIDEYPNWVISDVRMFNEAQAIKDRGGIIIRIDRPGFGPINNHPSETELDNWPFDYKILNASDLVSLKATVEVVLNKILC